VREGGRSEGRGREGVREGGGSEEGGGSKKGGGSEEGGGSDGGGRESWVVLGPHRSLWVVVVGTRCVLVILVYHSRAFDLPWSFLSQCDVAADGWGRGDVKGASCQPPVGSRRWWCCVTGVGGNRRGGVAYLSIIK